MNWMVKMTNLSPAAQKIINTFPIDNEEDLFVIASAFAKVIRIATDEVTEYKDEPTPENTPKGIDFGYAWAVWHKNASIRQRLLSLANELDPLIEK